MSASHTTKGETSGNMKNPDLVRLDGSMEGHKAVVIINEEPIYGTIKKVDSKLSGKKGKWSQFCEIFVTMYTEEERSLHFNVVEKLSRNEFRLISDDVYQHWVSANNCSIMNLMKEQAKNRAMEGSKAMVIMEGKPIYGTVKKVSTMDAYRKFKHAQLDHDVNITLVTEDGSSFSFPAGDKMENGEFKLLSDDEYYNYVENVINKMLGSEQGIQIRKPEYRNYPHKLNTTSSTNVSEKHVPNTPSAEIIRTSSLELVQGTTKPKIVRHQEPKNVPRELILDSSVEGKRAVVYIDGKPNFGRVKKVQQAGVKVFIQMVTENGEILTFEATKKIARDEFRIISYNVFKKWTAASDKVLHRSLEDKLNRKSVEESSSEELPMFIPFASNQKTISLKDTISGNSADDGEKIDDLSEVLPGDIVQTRILDGKYKGSFFVRTEVLEIEKDTMDLRVLHPEKWQVAGTAYRVPKDLIRTLSTSELDGYLVPIELDLDHSIEYVQCNKGMKVEDLKNTIFKLRDIEPQLVSFVTQTDLNLSDKSLIPDDALICRVHRLGRVVTITRS